MAQKDQIYYLAEDGEEDKNTGLSHDARNTFKLTATLMA